MVCLEKCCCCLRLRTGAIVLGCWGMVNGILMIIVTSVIVPKVMENVPSETNTELPSGNNYVMIGIQAFLLLMNILLILGAFKRIKILLILWLITEGTLIFFYGIVIVVLGGIIMVMSVMIGIVFYIMAFSLLGLAAYFWVCVLSFHQELKLEEQETITDLFVLEPLTV